MAKMFPDPTEEQLAELRAIHGDDMRVVESDGMTFVIALPPEDSKVQAFYKRFTDAFEAGKREQAFAGLFPALAVYPDQDTIRKVLARRPGLVRSVGVAASELLGVVPSDVKKD